MTEKAFAQMAERIAYGTQSLGTGIGTGYSTQAAEGAKIISSMKTIGTTAGTVATVRALKGDTMGLMQRLKSYGALKALGTIALAGTAFEVGWKIGKQLSTLFFGAEESEPPPPKGSHEIIAQYLEPKAWGDSLCTGFEDKGSCAVVGAVAPNPGFIVTWKEPPFSVVFPYIVPTPCEPHFWHNEPAGARFIQTGTITGTCGAKVETRPMGVLWVDAGFDHLPGETGVTEPKDTRTGSSETPANNPTATERAEACLMTAACGRLGAWWWNHDPKAQEETAAYPGSEGVEPSDPLEVRVPAPLRHENYKAYDKRLEALELTPENIELPEEFTNPAYGPEEVTQVNPKTGTQLKPEAVVKVRYNPATATKGSPAEESEVAPGGTGPWSPPGVRGIDLTPLEQVTPCNVFPFGAACWFVESLDELGAVGKCPTWELEFLGGVGGLEGEGQQLGVCEIQPVVEGVRPWEYFVGTIFMFLAFASWARSRGVPADRAGGDDA